MIHNKEMKSTERKYLIALVLDMLGDFDSDKHSPGSYVVLDKEHRDVKVEEEEKDEKIRKRRTT